jgi:hypothetical protein
MSVLGLNPSQVPLKGGLACGGQQGLQMGACLSRGCQYQTWVICRDERITGEVMIIM